MVLEKGVWRTVFKEESVGLRGGEPGEVGGGGGWGGGGGGGGGGLLGKLETILKKEMVG